MIKTHMKDDLVPAVNAAMVGKRFVSPALSVSEGSSLNPVPLNRQVHLPVGIALPR